MSAHRLEDYPIEGLQYGHAARAPFPVEIKWVGGEAPAQWDVLLSDGTWAFVRYRGGYLGVDFATTEDLLGLEPSVIDYAPKFADRDRCDWSDVEPYLIHSLHLAAGRRYDGRGYTIVPPSGPLPQHA
ncbi:MAG: hypothetical protein JNJ73_12065 [Hyphomonadaceae bacterium]|nr:hypothetical protein [Hyphomonadaceae bacterium]